MTLANYKYTANSGTVYQVTIPSDFAAALGQTPAVGTEPYLDATISPRYANFRSASGGFLRAALIDTASDFGSIPSTLVVGGVTYNFVSAIGEVVPPFLLAYQMAPQGPQGAQGATGATGATGPAGPAGVSPLINISGTIPSGTINGTGAAIIATPVAAPGAGKYISLVRQSAAYNPGGTGFTTTGNITVNIGTGPNAILFTSTNIGGTTALVTDATFLGQVNNASAFVNGALTIQRAATASGGNGSIDWNFLYQILPT